MCTRTRRWIPAVRLNSRSDCAVFVRAGVVEQKRSSGRRTRRNHVAAVSREQFLVLCGAHHVFGEQHVGAGHVVLQRCRSARIHLLQAISDVHPKIINVYKPILPFRRFVRLQFTGVQLEWRLQRPARSEQCASSSSRGRVRRVARTKRWRRRWLCEVRHIFSHAEFTSYHHCWSRRRQWNRYENTVQNSKF